MLVFFVEKQDSGEEQASVMKSAFTEFITGGWRDQRALHLAMEAETMEEHRKVVGSPRSSQFVVIHVFMYNKAKLPGDLGVGIKCGEDSFV